MSITARPWTEDDLERLAIDDNLLTVFFNRQGYSEKETKRLYELSGRRKTYFIYSFSSEEEEDVRRVYAVSDDSLRWFLKQEYRYSLIDSIIEAVSTTREVSL